MSKRSSSSSSEAESTRKRVKTLNEGDDYSLYVPLSERKKREVECILPTLEFNVLTLV